MAKCFYRRHNPRDANAPHLDTLWLDSCFGRGEADASRVVNLITVVATKHQADFAQDWRTQVETLVLIGFLYEARRGGAAHNVLRQEWERIDLLLPDHADLYDRLAAQRNGLGPNFARLTLLIQECLSVRGC